MSHDPRGEKSAVRGRWCVLALLAVCAAGGLGLPLLGFAQDTRPSTGTATLSPQEFKREYRRRYDLLAPNDVAGHYQLAEWCRENNQYQLLFKQAGYVLRLDPEHENARLLYRIAADHLRQAAAQSRPVPGKPAAESDGEFLTPTQIQKIKWAEFLDPQESVPATPIAAGNRAAAEPRGRQRETEEFLRVRYAEGVLKDFLDSMSGRQGFSSSEQRRTFLELPPTTQVQMIRRYSGDAYQNRIEITNDPLVFRQFQQVLPIITNGCGTTACHGGDHAVRWRLRTARQRTDMNLYTNWLIVNRAHRGKLPLVNRDNMPVSLLLQYGLPANQAMYHHPDPIRAVFPQRNDDVRYRAVLDWIEMLRRPAPRVGVSLPGYPEPSPPQIGGTPQENAPASQPTQ